MVIMAPEGRSLSPPVRHRPVRQRGPVHAVRRGRPAAQRGERRLPRRHRGRGGGAARGGQPRLARDPARTGAYRTVGAGGAQPCRRPDHGADAEPCAVAERPGGRLPRRGGRSAADRAARHAAGSALHTARGEQVTEYAYHPEQSRPYEVDIALPGGKRYRKRYATIEDYLADFSARTGEPMPADPGRLPRCPARTPPEPAGRSTDRGALRGRGGIRGRRAGQDRSRRAGPARAPRDSCSGKRRRSAIGGRSSPAVNRPFGKPRRPVTRPGSREANQRLLDLEPGAA